MGRTGPTRRGRACGQTMKGAGGICGRGGRDGHGGRAPFGVQQASPAASRDGSKIAPEFSPGLPHFPLL